MSQLFASGGQKYLSFSFSISPSCEYSGLISFRIDWFALLAVPGTLRSSPAPQFESIKIWKVNIFFIHNHAYSKKELLFIKDIHSVILKKLL